MVGPRERASRRAVSGRVNRRPPSFAVTLIALAVVFALAWMFFVRTGPAETTPPIPGIEGTYTWRSPGGIDEDGVFSAVAGGDAGGRAETPERRSVFSYWPPDSAYAADTRTETTVGGNGGREASSTRTVGAWPPLWRVATRSPLDYQGLAAIVRTAVEDGDDNVGIKPFKEGDRVVWRAAMTVDGKEITAVVDQESGLVTWYSDGDDTFTARVDWDSAPPPDTTYVVQTPEDARTETRVDDEFTYAGSPAAAGETAGYAPLVSDLAPDDYALKAVATTRAELRPWSWISDDVVSLPTGLRGTAVALLYTRGLSAFTVEQVGSATLGSLPDLPDWAAEGRGRLSFQETTLQFGAFTGETALTWYQQSGPSLFVAGARRAVFVTGALTRQELIAFAEGLKPVAADAQP